MPDFETIKNEINELRSLFEGLLRNFERHSHDGKNTSQIIDKDIFGNIPARVNVKGATIATTGNTDEYIIAPISGHIESVDFSGTDALATSDTNYITFSIVNLGRDGSGTTNVLSTGNENTTKTTGGSALSANTVRELTLSNASNAARVVKGDRIRIRAAVTGTLANTITNPIYMVRIK